MHACACVWLLKSSKTVLFIASIKRSIYASAIMVINRFRLKSANRIGTHLGTRAHIRCMYTKKNDQHYQRQWSTNTHITHMCPHVRALMVSLSVQNCGRENKTVQTATRNSIHFNLSDLTCSATRRRR